MILCNDFVTDMKIKAERRKNDESFSDQLWKFIFEISID